jgi:hypothetical protein
MVEVPVKLYLDKLLKLAREAVRPFSLMTGPARDKALRGMAAAIAEAEEEILAANEKDVDAVGKSMTGYEKQGAGARRGRACPYDGPTTSRPWWTGCTGSPTCRIRSVRC